MKDGRIDSVVVFSDPHFGCRFGLCPPGPIEIDEGFYSPSAMQRIVWSWWQHFWHTWVPEVTHGRRFAVVLNGDCLDGRHHGSTTQISQDLSVQKDVALKVLRPIVKRCRPEHFHMVRGTEAHVGPNAENEKDIAEMLGVPRPVQELWMPLGKGLIHFAHHIGGTDSAPYESTAVLTELISAYTDAGRWRRRSPDVVVRSHRHRSIEVRVPTDLGYGITFVTAAWQLKTPFVYRTKSGRVVTPQIGGSVICQGDEDLYTRHWVKGMKRPRMVKP